MKSFVFLLVVLERSYEALQLGEERARSLLISFLALVPFEEEESGKASSQAEKKHASPLLSCVKLLSLLVALMEEEEIDEESLQAEKHPSRHLSRVDLFPLAAPMEEQSDEAFLQAEKKHANPPMEEQIDEEPLQEEKHSGHLLSCVELFPLVARMKKEEKHPSHLFPLVAPMEDEIGEEDSDEVNLQSRATGDGDGPFMESRTAVVGGGGPFMNFGGSGPRR
uniref:Uncharacterized protein n=1 Tax=Oryza sativa subsp. japonica TaxID=39947 RepID=Q69L51_ORYSJ|nr:hypothetical protein [Oryza sativa Japonica Group]